MYYNVCSEYIIHQIMWFTYHFTAYWFLLFILQKYGKFHLAYMYLALLKGGILVVNHMILVNYICQFCTKNANFISLCCFMLFSFVSDVKKAHDDFSISVKYYTPVTCFLTFNLCSVLGNLIPNLLPFVST